MKDKIQSNIFSLNLPSDWTKFLLIPLYGILILSALANLEANPWQNNLPSTVDADGDKTTNPIVDVPWFELETIHYTELEFEDNIINTTFDGNNCVVDVPKNTPVNSKNPDGKEIVLIFSDNSIDDSGFSSSICDQKTITQGTAYLSPSTNGSFVVTHFAPNGTSLTHDSNYQFIRWTLLGLFSSIIILLIEQPELKNKLQNIRNNYSNRSTKNSDSWVFSKPENILEHGDVGKLIDEHPKNLQMVESSILTPWFFVVSCVFLFSSVIIIEFANFSGINLLNFLNNEVDKYVHEGLYFIFVICFVLPLLPFLLLGLIFDLRNFLRNSLGVIYKKRKVTKLIDDTPTQTVQGLAVGKVEIAGVAMVEGSDEKMAFKDYETMTVSELKDLLNASKLPVSGRKSELISRLHEYSKRKDKNAIIIERKEESFFGIKNPDNWPILKHLTLTKMERYRGTTRRVSESPNDEISFLVNDGTGSIRVNMPRSCFILGERISKQRFGAIVEVISKWSIAHGDPVLVIGEAIIGEDNSVYVGVNSTEKDKSVVFKGTEWTVMSNFRSTLEYCLVDVFLLLFIILTLLRIF